MELIKENIHQHCKFRYILKNIFKLTFVILAVICTSCSDLTDAQKLEKYKNHVAEGESLVDLNRYREAIIHSDSAINITDTLSAAFFIRGVANYELNNLKPAKKDFTEVIDIDGKKSRAYKNRALTFLKLNDSNFLDDIDQYLQNYPSDISARTFRINYFVQKKNYSKAIVDYEFLLLKDSDNLDLQKKLSDLKFKNGNFSEALQQYEEILKSSPDDADVIQKKQNLEKQLADSNNKFNFIYLLLGSYLSYIFLTFVIIRPIVKGKARRQIGGELVVASDPLIWLLPIILCATFFYLNYFSQIPTINFS